RSKKSGCSTVMGIWCENVFIWKDVYLNFDSVSPLLSQLSLYTRPQQKIQRVQPERGQVEESVATLRKLAEPYATRCQVKTQSCNTLCQTQLVFLKKLILGTFLFDFLQKTNPSCQSMCNSFLGIFFLSFQGSRLKKLIYPTGLMAVAASMYYPQEAVTVAKNTGDTVYDWALQAYVAVEKLIKGKPASKKVTEKSSSGETKA
uniref:MICOS complex subunit n=1 Tax=Sinocyclocheilus grahami TaxID=75366 RepID=A0A672R082_SINGR